MAIDRRTYTAEDWAALEEKLEIPDKTILCPRCGNEITYEERGNSIAVECKTEGCIFGGLRGL